MSTAHSSRREWLSSSPDIRRGKSRPSSDVQALFELLSADRAEFVSPRTLFEERSTRVGLGSTSMRFREHLRRALRAAVGSTDSLYVESLRTVAHLTETHGFSLSAERPHAATPARTHRAFYHLRVRAFNIRAPSFRAALPPEGRADVSSERLMLATDSFAGQQRESFCASERRWRCVEASGDQAAWLSLCQGFAGPKAIRAMVLPGSVDGGGVLFERREYLQREKTASVRAMARHVWWSRAHSFVPLRKRLGARATSCRVGAWLQVKAWPKAGTLHRGQEYVMRTTIMSMVSGFLVDVPRVCRLIAKNTPGLV